MAYRFRIWSGEASGGNVRMKVTVEKQAADNSWATIEDGARYVTLSTDAVLAITNDAELTNQQKLSALADLFRAAVGGANLPLADEAATDIAALLPAGYPVVVAL
jgi:hypothetical protein